MHGISESRSLVVDADAEHKWAYAQEQCKRFDPFDAPATLPGPVEEAMFLLSDNVYQQLLV